MRPFNRWRGRGAPRSKPLAGHTGFDKEDLAGIYEAFAALAATIYAVPLNDIQPSELYDNVTGGGGGSPFKTPKPFESIIEFGLWQFSMMALGYVTVMQVRGSHVMLYAGVRSVNLSLFGFNCLEMIVLTMVPYSYGAVIYYIHDGRGDIGDKFLFYVALMVLLLLAKLGQIWYLLRTSAGNALLVGAGSSSVAQDDIEQQLIGPDDSDNVTYAAGGSDEKTAADSESGILSVGIQHLRLMEQANVVTVAIYAFVGLLLYVLSSGFPMLLLFGITWFSTKKIAQRGIDRCEKRLALGPPSGDAATLQRSIAVKQCWQAWRGTLNVRMDRFMAFRDGVFGFVITSVILSVEPADDPGNTATTLWAYLSDALPFIRGYLAVAVSVLSVYTVSYLTTSHFDMSAGSFRARSDWPWTYNAVLFGLAIPMLLSIFLPFLALLANKLYLADRHHDALLAGLLFLGWYLLTVLISLGCWIIIVVRRDLFAPKMTRENAASVLTFTIAVALTALLSATLLPFGWFWQLVLYMLPLVVIAVDYCCSESCISLLWRDR